MLTALVIPELNMGLMTAAVWEGEFDREDQGDYVFYRDRGTRDASGRPERDIVPAAEAINKLFSYYSDKAEEYENLLSELRTILEKAEDDYTLYTDDLRRKLSPWLEREMAPA